MQTEHVYTGKGRQRAVFLRPDTTEMRFGVELLQGDEGVVEVSYDPVEMVRRGRGEWCVFEGGLGGSLHSVTAIRLNIRHVDGWMKLFIEQGVHGNG